MRRLMLAAAVIVMMMAAVDWRFAQDIAGGAALAGVLAGPTIDSDADGLNCATGMLFVRADGACVVILDNPGDAAAMSAANFAKYSTFEQVIPIDMPGSSHAGRAVVLWFDGVGTEQVAIITEAEAWIIGLAGFAAVILLLRNDRSFFHLAAGRNGSTH